MTDTSPTIAHPQDLPYQLACDAYRNTSFTPERRATSDQQTYADDVNGLYADMLRLAITDQQKALLAEEMERYRQGYLERYKAYLASHANVASPMITGPARFPIARNEKRSHWADNKRHEFLEWRNKARTAIQRKLLDARPEEQKAAAAWRALERDIKGSLAVIEAIDAGRSPYTRSSFSNSIAGKIERLAMQGEVELVAQAMDVLSAYNRSHEKPCFTARHKVWHYPELSRQQAAEKDAKRDAQPETIAQADGVDIVANPQADRVQIVFAAKPSIEIIGKLKAEGWHWSRTEGAWQRKLTEAAKHSAKRIVGLA